MKAKAPWRVLGNPLFARLYLAQTSSLLGDAFTWVGLALLAFQLGGGGSAALLAGALTLRVLAFVSLSPLGGVLADRVDRKALMGAADLGRALVLGLMPFAQEVGQVYVLMFALNALTALFTPAYQAALPQVAGRDYPQAIALSGATYEALGVLGPGLAGGLAGLLGARGLFLLDALSFLFSALLVLSLPVRLRAEGPSRHVPALPELSLGTVRLWRDPKLRHALLLELVAAFPGALVLVGSVGLVQGQLGLGEGAYGLAMAAFGGGATLAALLVGALEGRVPRLAWIFWGALASSLAVLPADALPFLPLLALWALAGAGQNWVNLPTQALIADRTPTELQGRVYGAHFAWSHLWWTLAYPLAGWLATHFPDQAFFYGGSLSLALLAGSALTRRWGQKKASG